MTDAGIRPASAALEQLVASWRTARRHRYRSAKLRGGRVLVDREMFDVDVPPDEEGPFLAATAMPASLVTAYRRLRPGADSVHVAVEGDGGVTRRKVYLHAAEGLAGAVFVALSWDPARPEATRTTAYRAPAGTGPVLDVLAGAPNGVRRAVRALVEPAEEDRVRGSRLLVVDDGSRRSLDIPVLHEGWTVAEALTHLEPLAEAADVDTAALGAADPTLPRRRLARVAVGVDHDGHPFTTLFHLDPIEPSTSGPRRPVSRPPGAGWRAAGP